MVDLTKSPIGMPKMPHPHRAHKAGASATQADDLFTKGPSTFDSIADGTGSMLNLAGTGAFLVPMLLAPVSRGIGWVGEKTGSSHIKKLGERIHKPVDYLNRPLNEVLPSSVSTAAHSVADYSAGPIQRASEWTGIAGNRAAAHVAKTHKALAKTQKLVGGIATEKLPAAIEGQVKQIHKLIEGAEHLGHVDMHAVSAAHESIGKLMQNPAVAEVAMNAKGFKKFSGSIDSLVHHHGQVKGWTKVGESVREIPSKIGQTKLGDGLMNASFVGMSGLDVYGEGRSFSRNLAALKQMYADMTGKDPKKVSTAGVLFGSVPAPIAEARSHLLKTTAIGGGSSLGGLAANVAMAISNRFHGVKGMAALMVPQFVGMAAKSYMGESVLPVYQAISQAHKRGEELPPEAIAVFIGNASKELKARGAEESAFTRALAAQYAKEKASPKQMLQEIANGKLLQRIGNLITEVESAQQSQQQAAPAVSHTDRLNGKGAATNRQVVGEHTERLANSDPAHQPGAPSL